MISGVNLSQYYKVVSMTNSLNNFIRQATITKSQINASLASTFAGYTGIGNNVDVFA